MNASNSDVSRLYLVRHGATDANDRRPYILQGCGIDLPLNEQGRRQAGAVAKFFQPFEIDAVVTSPLRRARETADAIADPHRCPLTTIDALRECDVGEWEGKDWGTVMREHPEAYREFMARPGYVPYLGGESYADVLERVRPVIQDLAAEYSGSSIVVVAHQVVLRAYLCHLLGMDLDRARTIRQSNTGVNVVYAQNGELELRTLNADFHLLDVR